MVTSYSDVLISHSLVPPLTFDVSVKTRHELISRHILLGKKPKDVQGDDHTISSLNGRPITSGLSSYFLS